MKAKPPLSKFEEALAWFRKRVPITKDKWWQLKEDVRRRHFTVAGLAQLDMVNQVFQDIQRALDKGETLAEFRKRTIGKLTRAWSRGTPGSPDSGGEPWRIETIFRTNLQLAYSAGRMEQLQRPEIRALRPFWRFAALLDTRTTDVCKLCDGTTLPAGHVWFRTHTPPLHFNCRSTIVALTRSAAEAEGISKSGPRKLVPLRGFGTIDDVWEPDLSGYPKALLEKFRQGRRLR